MLEWRRFRTRRRVIRVLLYVTRNKGSASELRWKRLLGATTVYGRSVRVGPGRRDGARGLIVVVGDRPAPIAVVAAPLARPALTGVSSGPMIQPIHFIGRVNAVGRKVKDMLYVFVPFPGITDRNFTTTINQLQGTLVLANQAASQPLRKFHASQDQLYVMGHCAAGSDRLYPDSTGQNAATAGAVVSLLLQAGFPSPKILQDVEITLIACEAKAGSTSGPNSRPSFAALLQGALRDAAYKKVTLHASFFEVRAIAHSAVEVLPPNQHARPGRLRPLTASESSGSGPSSPRPGAPSTVGSGIRHPRFP